MPEYPSRQGLCCCLLATGLLAAGCSSMEGAAYPRNGSLIPAASVKLSEGITLSLEKLATLAAAGYVIMKVVDPLAPNWQISEVRIDDEHYLLNLQMKRFHLGGAGEARQVFQRRAEQLAIAHRATAMQIARYGESLDSSGVAPQRVAEGVVRLSLPPPEAPVAAVAPVANAAPEVSVVPAKIKPSPAPPPGAGRL